MKGRLSRTVVVLLGVGAFSYLALTGCAKKDLPTRPAPVEGFTVSSVKTSVDPVSYAGHCPGTFGFSAQITTNDSGYVVYRWERSDGTESSPVLVHFASAGTQTATTQWDLSTVGSYWERIHVVAPNDLVSEPIHFTNQCGISIGVTTKVTPVTYSGPCPGPFEFSAAITSNGQGPVTYRWEDSDGNIGPEQQTDFDVAGTRTVTTLRWILTEGTHWERIHVLAPKDVTSEKATFQNACTGFGALATVTANTIDSGECYGSFEFSAAVMANGAGTVTYRWERSDGQTGPTETLSFDAAGTRTVTTPWQVDVGGDFWQRLHLLSPNDLESNLANVYVDCGWCWSCERAR